MYIAIIFPSRKDDIMHHSSLEYDISGIDTLWRDFILCRNIVNNISPKLAKVHVTIFPRHTYVMLRFDVSNF